MSNTKPHISLFDKSFDETKTSSYKLYIELSNNGIKHTIFNIDNNTFIGFEEFKFVDIHNDYSLVKPLKDVLNVSTIYKNEFESINVAFVNHRATLIPKAIYKSNKLENFHQFNFSIQEEDQFFSDHLINLSAYNVYSIPDSITRLFNDFKNVRFMHFSSSLIEASLLNTQRNKSHSLILVNVLPTSFQIIVVNNQKLELYNSFFYQSIEDFIYYLLFVLDQLNIKNDETSITLTGEVENNSSTFEMLNKYINTLNFGHRPDNLNFSYIFDEIQKHTHYSLFNQFLCE